MVVPPTPPTPAGRLVGQYLPVGDFNSRVFHTMLVLAVRTPSAIIVSHLVRTSCLSTVFLTYLKMGASNYTGGC